MGLDGSVRCNCFEQGRTSSLPIPIDWLEIDEEGYLNLRTEYNSDERFVEVYQWMQSACPHPDMRQASEHISNWPGYRSFQQALGRGGWEHFPMLRSVLPESNGGLVLPSASALALGELAHFRSLGQLGNDTFLVDTTTGEAIHRHIAAYEGVFLYGGGAKPWAGIGATAFFVEDTATGRCLFRSAHFRQTRIGDSSTGELVELEDLDNGSKYCGPVAVRRYVPWPDGRWQDDKGRCNYLLPAELHVESRAVTPSDFAHIVGPLERLFSASVETGNPVRWS